MKYIKIVLINLLGFGNLSGLSAQDFIWFNGKTPISYSIDKNAAPVVQSVLEMWKNDMQQVTGFVPVEASAKQATVRIVQDNRHPVLQKNGLPEKEAFFISIKKNQIYIIGSDARGTAYGILELSRLAGVSPWIWWSDAAPERKSRLTLPADFQTFQSPVVEYRGVFINDEDWSTMPFATKNEGIAGQARNNSVEIKKGEINARYYEKLFQLLLRLRANTLQPAMHECTVPFYLVEGNREMAERYGIVIGTSHCEPLLCNAAGEWDIRGKGAYNYITNKENVLAFWKERLQELGSSENIFTIGMRGKHDGSMEGVKTMQEKTAALQQVIDDQRKMLETLRATPLHSIPQQFVPYKEVLDIYENGLNVPDDIMLTWCDDNYGYLTRLSNQNEQKRSGGAGVYYHLSYWGRPHDYLWLTTTQPGLIYYEMRNAYELGARRMWIANVHDPKIAAYDLEFFLDLAWGGFDTGALHAEMGHAPSLHLQKWLIREFGTAAGEKLFPAMHEYYRLVSIRRPEFMAFSQVEVDDRKKYPDGKTPAQPSEFSFERIAGQTRNNTLSEAEQYLADYQNIKNTVSEAEKNIPASRHDEFFAAIKYPVFAAAAMAEKWLCADGARSVSAYNEIVALTDYYNNEMAEGKWRYSMNFKPRNLNVFDTARTTSLHATPLHTTSQQQYIACNACDFTVASCLVEPIAMLGHSMNAVPLPKDETLTYEFETAESTNTAILYTAVIPTHPNDHADIRFSVQIDSEQPQIVSFREKGRTEQWKRNVLRQQALKITHHTLTQGKHTLKITALDNHVVVDQWFIDFDKDRKFYILPVKN